MITQRRKYLNLFVHVTAGLQHLVYPRLKLPAEAMEQAIRFIQD
jgi:hypothetical protein